MDAQTGLEPTQAAARALDLADALAPWRERFAFPVDASGRPVAYFCGHSLGLQPRAARELLEEELDAWARLAVDGHFEAKRPWYSYHEECREPLSRLVGARPREVVAMNSLTVNLHLLMVSFYRPTAARRAILIEEGAFPSDLYAVQSQIAAHGGDPEADLIVARPRDGAATLDEADVEALIHEQRDRLALVLWPGVQYLSGQAFDLARLARATHAAGAVFGVDAAHAAGNLALKLHDHDVDFAVWCSYKYGNSGPGAVAGAYVHERHVESDLPRFSGWWGNDPARRFAMHEERAFHPVASADAWQLSNPPILAMAPLLASLQAFDEVTIDALREKSIRLTGYLEVCLRQRLGERVEILTPTDPACRGAQLSIRVGAAAREVRDRLGKGGVVVDLRPPDVLRIAPAPFYVSFADVWRGVVALEDALEDALGTSGAEART